MSAKTNMVTKYSVVVDAYEIAKNDESDPKWIASRLHYVMLKHNNPAEFEGNSYPTAEQTNDLIIKNVEEIFKYASNGQLEKFIDLMSVVPNLKTIKSGCGTLWQLPSEIKKRECMFWKVIIQLHVYIQSKQPPVSGKFTKILNSNIDYRTFLELTQMDGILNSVQNQASALQKLTAWSTNEISKNVNERFKGLGTYFTKVERFNKAKGNADIEYVIGELGKYAQKVSSLTTEWGEKLDSLINSAIAAVALEMSEDVVRVGMAAAAFLNPLEKIVGGTGLGDYMDRQAKLAQTVTRVGETLRAKKTYSELLTKTIAISNGFNKNGEFLENVRVLITSIDEGATSDDFEARKQEFLEQYQAYSPQVSKPELTAMTTTWENLIEETCEVIFSNENTLSQAVVGDIRASGKCSKPKVLAQKMIAMYEEIFDFQSVLMEAMATYMRAATAINAASNIAGNYDTLSRNVDGNEGALENVKFISALSFVSYKVNIWLITEDYCNILEYKEGGVRPSVCKGVNANIASLVSHVSPTCRTVNHYYDVPITSENDKAFMNIADLYSGKVVDFKIPNRQWLVDNKWISEKDIVSAIVVKKFDIFMLTESPYERRARVEAKVVGFSRFLRTDTKRYMIVPQKKFISEYNEGRDAQCMQASRLLTNPYGSALPQICPLNVDENNCMELLQKTPLFPSIYSQWKLSISGYESAQVPNPVNHDFRLKVGVKLCILDQQSDHEGEEFMDRKNRKGRRNRNKNGRKNRSRNKPAEVEEKPPEPPERSCPAPGEYWSIEARGCAPCAEGSSPALHDYCEKNQE